MSGLQEITFQKSQLNPEKIIQTLKNHGICIIPSYFDDMLMKRLNEEFDQVQNSTAEYIKPLDYSNGTCVELDLWKTEEERFPLICQVFKSEEFDKIADKHFEKFILNNKVIVAKDIVGTNHIANDLHFDITRTLKFFVYLTDTKTQNGAFTCVPGSHLKSREIKKKVGHKISRQNRQPTRDLPIEKYPKAIPVEGKAGTLIIFDTDVWHKAGMVAVGERRVMRGHTIPIADRKFSLISKIRRKFRFHS